MAEQASGMTSGAFRNALQSFVETLRARDHAHQGNVTHGFGQAASAQITATPDISERFHGALNE
eukprot:11262409-Alexandrium_andersonii.AAC.1